jgi:hypothetical protein
MLKMRSIPRIGVLIFLAVFLWPCWFSYTQGLSSDYLIKNAKELDGKTVVYVGEVIGDIMPRGDFVWVNVNDGKNAIGIWMTKEMTKEIIFSGSYKTTGDLLEVTGIFNKACKEHGGDLDIHALSVKKIDAGRIMNEKLRMNIAKRNFAVVLFGVILAIWILKILKIR